MKCNVGILDRWLRIVAGLILVAAGFVFSSWFGLLGIVILATGMFRFCPLYLPFKLDTNRKEES